MAPPKVLLSNAMWKGAGLAVLLSIFLLGSSGSQAPSRRELLSSPVEDSLSRFKEFRRPNVSQLNTTSTSLVLCEIGSRPESSFRHSGSSISITVRTDLNPVQGLQFLSVVESGYYDGCYIFRVLKGFVAQFGLRPKWMGWAGPKFSRAKSSPHSGSLSNARGTVAFAGGSPTQVFVNMGDNSRLDGDGRPFATLDAGSMEIIDQLYTGYKDGDGQVGAVNSGPQAVSEKFPHMSWIKTCKVASSA